MGKAKKMKIADIYSGVHSLKKAVLKAHEKEENEEKDKGKNEKKKKKKNN